MTKICWTRTIHLKRASKLGFSYSAERDKVTATHPNIPPPQPPYGPTLLDFTSGNFGKIMLSAPLSYPLHPHAESWIRPKRTWFRLKSVHTEATLSQSPSFSSATPLIFLTGTVTGRMGYIPIFPVNRTFGTVTVTLTELLGVNRPWEKHIQNLVFSRNRFSSSFSVGMHSALSVFKG